MPAYYVPTARCDCGARWPLVNVELPDAVPVTVALPPTTQCPGCGQAFTVAAAGERIYLIRQPPAPAPPPSDRTLGD